jgi:hypothetical protein
VSGEMDDTDRANGAERAPKSNGPVARLLELADAAAARGDYADAVAWLRRLEGSGHQLDLVYEERRERWQSKAEPRRVGCSQWFG